MEATHVNDDPTLIVPNRAVGYRLRSADLTREARELGLYVRDQPGWLQLPRVAPHYGGSGVFSTLEDLAKWDANFYTGRLAGPAFTELMGRRERFGHGKDNDAFGLYWDEFEGRRLLAYDGSDVDGSSYMARFPEQRTTVIVLSNISSGSASARAYELMRLLIRSGAL
jgi:CubicO group peptidase (beta-lactamase class C family)